MSLVAGELASARTIREDRAPVPGEDVQLKLRQELKATFGAEYRSKDRTERVEFCNRLLELGKAVSSNDADLRYVLLSESAKIAASISDLAAARRSIDELSSQFRVDRLENWFTFLRGLKGELRPSVGDLARHYLEIVEQILRERDPINDPVDYPRKPLFEEVMTIAHACLEVMESGNANSELRADRAELKAWATHIDEFRTHRSKLASDRTDAKANAFVGWFYCVRNGDWKLGLEYLAKGEGAAADLARAELANPESADELTAIADRWKELADAERSGRRVSAALRGHAADIYRSALAVLPKESFLAEKVRRKLSAIELDEPAAAGFTDSGSAPRPEAAPPKVTFGGKYARRAAREGGAATDAAVGEALDWLVRHQDPAGYWPSAGFTKACQQNRCSGEGVPGVDVGVTGLALLAFLGAGNTPNTGEHREVVTRGIAWLVSTQHQKTGLFGEVGSHVGYHYDHAIATHAVIEAFGLSKDESLRGVAEKAVRRIERAHNPYQGWRYEFPGNRENDMSITGFMVLALCAARDFDLEVDASILEQTTHWIDSMTDPDTGRVGYLKPGGFGAREPGMLERWPVNRVEPMTASALCCRFALGGSAKVLTATAQGSKLLRSKLPLWDDEEGTIDLYYWYYGSQAAWQLGGTDWDAWQQALHRALLSSQRKDGDERGSWDPEYDPWGHKGGRVYATAMATLCLEAPYRYTRPKAK